MKEPSPSSNWTGGFPASNVVDHIRCEMWSSHLCGFRGRSMSFPEAPNVSELSRFARFLKDTKREASPGPSLGTARRERLDYAPEVPYPPGEVRECVVSMKIYRSLRL
jgi:hypothetical protein